MGEATSPGRRKYACSECGTRPSTVRLAAASPWPITCPPKTLFPNRSCDCPRKRFTSKDSRSSSAIRSSRISFIPPSPSAVRQRVVALALEREHAQPMAERVRQAGDLPPAAVFDRPLELGARLGEPLHRRLDLLHHHVQVHRGPVAVELAASVG